MKYVKYTGSDPRLLKGCTALMNDSGLVQLDGPKEMWRHGEEATRRYPLAYGWHDLGNKWEEVEKQV